MSEVIKIPLSVKILTLLDHSVILGDEQGLFAIVGLISLILGLEFMINIAAELLEKHYWRIGWYVEGL